MSAFSLKAVKGGLKGEEFLLDQKGLCLIGRDKSCSISIPREKDFGVSRRHCLLILDPPNIRIRDLYSTNGTYVNSHRLLPAPIGENPEHENPNDRFLLDGDRVSISNIIFEVHVLSDIASNQETSKLSLDDAIPDTQTTKTKLIEFSKGHTRSDSLIPETNTFEGNKVLMDSDPIMEDTHMFLSLPITEPIPRPGSNIKQDLKNNSTDDKQINKENDSTLNTEPDEETLFKEEENPPENSLDPDEKITEDQEIEAIINEETTLPTDEKREEENEKSYEIPENNIDDESESLQSEEDQSENVSPLENSVDVSANRVSGTSMFDAQKMKAMEELAGALAHDYNKQLTVVMGYTELLKNTEDINKIKEYADTIFRSAQLSSELTQKLLMFASHKHDIGNTSVNLLEMLTEIVSVMKHTGGRNIVVEFPNHNNNNKPLYTKGDQLELYEALLNIAFNAVDSLSGHGKLTFNIKSVILKNEDIERMIFDIEPGDYFKITIEDTGCGISDDIIERIFEPFFTTKQSKQSLGMGLTVAYGVVKNHNGAINVESNSGEGTKFEIYLPSTQKGNGNKEDKVDAREKLADIEASVLLLDNEQNMRSLITEMLNLFHIEVIEKATPEDALEEYKRNSENIDLVIVDMIIPENGEMKFYKKLRESDQNVKVLFSSGYKPANSDTEEMKSDHVEILPKPYSADELYESVYCLL